MCHFSHLRRPRPKSPKPSRPAGPANSMCRVSGLRQRILPRPLAGVAARSALMRARRSWPVSAGFCGFAPVAGEFSGDGGFQQGAPERLQPLACRLKRHLTIRDLGKEGIDALYDAALFGERGEGNRKRSRAETSMLLTVVPSLEQSSRTLLFASFRYRATNVGFTPSRGVSALKSWFRVTVRSVTATWERVTKNT